MSVEKFSNNLTSFIEELNLTFPENPISIETHFSAVNDTHMTKFLTEMKA